MLSCYAVVVIRIGLSFQGYRMIEKKTTYNGHSKGLSWHEVTIVRKTTEVKEESQSWTPWSTTALLLDSVWLKTGRVPESNQHRRLISLVACLCCCWGGSTSSSGILPHIVCFRVSAWNPSHEHSHFCLNPAGRQHPESHHGETLISLWLRGPCLVARKPVPLRTTESTLKWQLPEYILTPIKQQGALFLYFQ